MGTQTANEEGLIVKLVKTAAEQALFLALPGRLYSRDDIMQDRKSERDILQGRHVLLAGAEVSAWMVTTVAGDRILARCLLTSFADDELAYIGFFECVERLAVCRLLLTQMEDEARRLGKQGLKGPLDLSFWLGYRFKVDAFDRPYTSEPYQKSYYADFWQACGYLVHERYVSNEYRQIPADYRHPKHSLRLKQMGERGYVFRHPHWWNFTRCLRDIYRMLTDLYSDFPGYRPITWPAFRTLFGGLRFVIDSAMVIVAYQKGQAAGFTVALPDYGNLLPQPFSLSFLRRLMRRKKDAKRYIILYMGVYPEHLGLGPAMAELIKQELRSRGATSVGALIREGKVTGNYFKDLQVASRHYVMLEKQLSSPISKAVL
ncbi:MAG: hypothetical protein SPL15_06755 [Lachnospiraceae bacterium]|nr:hypothetical protein [Lachnospiraceae bacterium]MDY5742676.1 hypothetical protein [Lachnospiraceae bacterium]